jgi:hypothetical protein
LALSRREKVAERLSMRGLEWLYSPLKAYCRYYFQGGGHLTLRELVWVLRSVVRSKPPATDDHEQPQTQEDAGRA